MQHQPIVEMVDWAIINTLSWTFPQTQAARQKASFPSVAECAQFYLDIANSGFYLHGDYFDMCYRHTV